jgi:putative DNA primase/helicase
MANIPADLSRPPKPTALQVIHDAIPPELKALNQWVVWRYAWLEDRQKWDKPPLRVRNGNEASSTNRATWGTFEDALWTYGTGLVDGIGFVFSKENRLVGIDLDHCRDHETGIIEPWALEIIDRFDTYTELSPSGAGVHLIAAGALPGHGVKTARAEMYDSGRYFTVTGHRMGVSR